jgi:hypothetical protein
MGRRLATLCVVRTAALVLLLGAVGCGHAVLVKGVATADTRPAITQGTSFFVEPDNEAEVETDRTEVTRKIAGLLEHEGYTITSSSDADFSLHYEYEITPLLGKMSFEPSRGGPHHGMSTVRREGPFNHRLYVWVAEVGSGEAPEAPFTVWASGAILNRAPTDGSRFLDVLLVATFDHFLEDTGDTLQTRMSLSNPRVKRLRDTNGSGATEAESAR